MLRDSHCAVIVDEVQDLRKTQVSQVWIPNGEGSKRWLTWYVASSARARGCLTSADVADRARGVAAAAGAWVVWRPSWSPIVDATQAASAATTAGFRLATVWMGFWAVSTGTASESRGSAPVRTASAELPMMSVGLELAGEKAGPGPVHEQQVVERGLAGQQGVRRAGRAGRLG